MHFQTKEGYGAYRKAQKEAYETSDGKAFEGPPIPAEEIIKFQKERGVSMNNETFLRNIKDDVDYVLEVTKDEKIRKTLERTAKRIDAQLADPEVLPHCGLYLFDGGRQYGYTLEQLDYLVDQWFDPKSCFHKQTRGFPQLIKWLYQVSRTSIGDLRGDMLKHVIATYDYPSADVTDEEYEKMEQKYDKFWEKAVKVIPTDAIKKR